MIEQTLCEQLVQRNRELTRTVDDLAGRIEKLNEQLERARKRSQQRAVEVHRLRNGRNLWRQRALR